ncbi:MAG TPA: hypothetical protein GX507_07015 [Clostridia bacterium]|nr:hypothetical protein [Clostridia bacterium]
MEERRKKTLGAIRRFHLKPQSKPLKNSCPDLARFLGEGDVSDAGRLAEYLSAGGYPFRAKVEEQQKEAARLAQLALAAADGDNPEAPEALYELGAAIYHKQDMYYNFLWAGERQGFNWAGHINELWSEVPEREGYMRGLMNYWHALKCFEGVEKAPRASDELKAEALYSQGLAYIGILEWGQDAEAVFDMKSVQDKIIATYKRFVATYPKSSMADDALLVLYAYTQDRTYLERIIDEYPNGDQVEAARRILCSP